MHQISSKLLFIPILLFPPLSPGLPDHKDLTRERYPGGTPPDSRRTLDYQFGIVQLPIGARADASGQSTACADSAAAIVPLADGVTNDSRGRTGCIVANRQFQFDYPPLNHDLLFSEGFSVEKNGILALGQDDVFYACPCERGEFCFPFTFLVACGVWACDNGGYWKDFRSSTT